MPIQLLLIPMLLFILSQTEITDFLSAFGTVKHLLTTQALTALFRNYNLSCLAGSPLRQPIINLMPHQSFPMPSGRRRQPPVYVAVFPPPPRPWASRWLEGGGGVAWRQAGSPFLKSPLVIRSMINIAHFLLQSYPVTLKLSVQTKRALQLH